jgi:Kef-type K+ transport system membrane component KefB
MIQKILLHLCRYVAATIVAFVASLGIIAVWRSVDPSTDTLTFLSRFTAGFFLFLIGFCGVFSGAWCLARATRWRGALVLVAFGFAFGAYLASLLPWQDQKSV